MVSANGTGVKEETVKEQRLRRRREARTESHRRRTNNDRLLNEFQPDAVEIEKQTVPGGARWTLYTVAGLICAFVGWASWAEVDKIVTAQGKLITTESAVVIDTKLQSPISNINAKFGDRVSAGFVIATLDPTFSEADLSQLQSQQEALFAVQARLIAERDGTPLSIEGKEDKIDWIRQNGLFIERKRLFSAEMRKYESKRSTLNVQIKNVQMEKQSALVTYSKMKDLEQSFKNLESRGSKSGMDVMSRELQVDEARDEYNNAESRRLDLSEQKKGVTAEQEAFTANWRNEIFEKLVTTSNELVKIEQEINKARRSNEFVELRVPENLGYDEFVVFEVADKSVGSIMKPGEPLFRLIPIGVAMEAEVEIEGKDIAIIKAATQAEMDSNDLPTGSDVRVKLASFPYQKHGTLDGIVRTISEGSFEKQSQGLATGITTYKARIRLPNPDQLEQLPEGFRLMPGMTTTCEIKVGRRKVIEYFLYPLIRYLGESVREP